MKIVKVKDIRIGEGAPKIIVPIVGKSKDEILDKAKNLSEMNIDAVEWRVDFFEASFDIESVLETLEKLKSLIPNLLIIFTFRTKKEGGEKEISMKDYTALNKAVALSGNADLIDVEVFSGDDVVFENIRNIHNAGSLVIGSNHDFVKTPPKEEIISRLKKMQNMNVDILKIGLMPTSVADVITLLDATNEMKTKYADRPIITISMGPMGVISRLAGEVFGSSMTFGAVGQTSAPGQIPVEDLSTVLNILHNSI